MTFYSQLGVPPTAEVHEIWAAGEQCLKEVTQKSVEEDLITRCGLTPHHVQKLAPAYVSEARAHICRVTRFLTDPASREIYDAWRTADTPHKKVLTNARIRHLNAHRGTNGIGLHRDFLFPETGESYASPAKVEKTATATPAYKCRFCMEPLTEEDMVILKCSCTARIGHDACTKSFMHEFGDKCPICRDASCKRKQISKYLFWNRDNKWSI